MRFFEEHCHVVNVFDEARYKYLSYIRAWILKERLQFGEQFLKAGKLPIGSLSYNPLRELTYNVIALLDISPRFSIAHKRVIKSWAGGH